MHAPQRPRSAVTGPCRSHRAHQSSTSLPSTPRSWGSSGSWSRSSAAPRVRRWRSFAMASRSRVPILRVCPSRRPGPRSRGGPRRALGGPLRVANRSARLERRRRAITAGRASSNSGGGGGVGVVRSGRKDRRSCPRDRFASRTRPSSGVRPWPCYRSSGRSLKEIASDLGVSYGVAASVGKADPTRCR